MLVLETHCASTIDNSEVGQKATMLFADQSHDVICGSKSRCYAPQLFADQSPRVTSYDMFTSYYSNFVISFFIHLLQHEQSHYSIQHGQISNLQNVPN